MDEEMELLCETLYILSDNGKAISEGVQETVKRQYFESEVDPPMEKFPEFLETDLKLLVDTVTILNDQAHNEEEFEETMKHFDERTTIIEPKDTEYYFEGVVMKNLQDKSRIKSKEMFRRVRESAHEIIKFIQKKLQVEDGDELKYEEDANNPPTETCPYRSKLG
jgi:hypothetical protein